MEDPEPPSKTSLIPPESDSSPEPDPERCEVEEKLLLLRNWSSVTPGRLREFMSGWMQLLVCLRCLLRAKSSRERHGAFSPFRCNLGGSLALLSSKRAADGECVKSLSPF